MIFAVLLALLGPDEAPPSYRLAVVPLEFADVRSGAADWNRFFFTDLAGYFDRASGGAFELRGEVRPATRLGMRRGDFRRNGLPLVRECDGVAFVAAGVLAKRGDPLWPHSGTLPGGTPYLLLPERAGGRELGIAAHEMMHLLGFDDKYDDEKSDVGDACILGTGYRTVPPAPPCADCRRRLGWAKPRVIDPAETVDVEIGDAPVSIRVNPDGGESLLLELRDDLLVWHVGGGMKIELLGRFSEGRLTPLSDPPFRGRSLGSRPVWITGIRLADGRARLRVGPDAPLTPDEEKRRAAVGKRLGR